MPYEITRVSAVHEGWSRFLIAAVRLPDGRTIRREIEDHGQAVAVLPYDPDRRCALLVSQFRPAVFYAGGPDELLEAPAGLLEDGEAPEDCARREATEETGLKLSRLEPVGVVWAMPGISTERMHLYLAPYAAADRLGEGGGLSEEHENITVLEIGLPQLAAEADRGGIVDTKTLVLIQTLRLWHPELFG